VISKEEIFELCNGCGVFTIKESGIRLNCDQLPKSKDKFCPCITCLIKMICTKACKEFRKYNLECNMGSINGR